MMKVTALFFVFIAASTAVPAVDWRVVGGSNAALGQFPYIISLRGSSGSHTCGGSLIRWDWVITAAHCVSGGRPSSYSVIAGTNQLDGNGVRRQVAEIIVHPKYSSLLSINDIALLRLETPFEESRLIKTIDMESSDIGDKIECSLIGWGRTSYPGTIPNELQFLRLLTVAYTSCKAQWAKVVESQICTYTQHGEGACHGDSGGPLVVEENGESRLIGLVSWGQPCAVGMPDVYTRVSSFYDWVLAHLDD